MGIHEFLGLPGTFHWLPEGPSRCQTGNAGRRWKALVAAGRVRLRRCDLLLFSAAFCPRSRCFCVLRSGGVES